MRNSLWILAISTTHQTSYFVAGICGGWKKAQKLNKATSYEITQNGTFEKLSIFRINKLSQPTPRLRSTNSTKPCLGKTSLARVPHFAILCDFVRSHFSDVWALFDGQSRI